jgi:hypothetical protein
MPHTTTAQRVLVVADIWCQIDGLCPRVREEIESSEADVRVVAPALAGRLHTMTSDLDTEISAATTRLEDALKRLNEHGVPACGEIGDPDPAQAIDDVLAEFSAVLPRESLLELPCACTIRPRHTRPNARAAPRW